MNSRTGSLKSRTECRVECRYDVSLTKTSIWELLSKSYCSHTSGHDRLDLNV